MTGAARDGVGGRCGGEQGRGSEEPVMNPPGRGGGSGGRGPCAGLAGPSRPPLPVQSRERGMRVARRAASARCDGAEPAERAGAAGCAGEGNGRPRGKRAARDKVGASARACRWIGYYRLVLNYQFITIRGYRLVWSDHQRKSVVVQQSKINNTRHKLSERIPERGWCNAKHHHGVWSSGTGGDSFSTLQGLAGWCRPMGNFQNESERS